ncbi:unnamed protein product [Adineta ricciae]|nr:unnamed protein product [Adineta ricciae]
MLGLDISERMLSKAKELSVDSTIVYRLEDLEQLELSPNTYDLAYSSLTLHYIERLSQLLKTIYQSLKSGGHFIFSSEHPIYTAPMEPGWSVAKDGRKSWPINNYQTEGRRVTDWLVKGVVKQHRTLGTYLNMLIKQGFIIKHVEEWGPTRQEIIENPSLDEEIERPMILLVSIQKPDRK